MTSLEASNRQVEFQSHICAKMMRRCGMSFRHTDAKGPKQRRKPMSKRTLNISVATVLMAGVAAASNVASAAPFADALAIRKAAATNIETVRWGRGFGWGLGAGLLGGALIGGALASPYYYGGPYYYYGYPPAYGPGYYPAPGYGGDAAYCAHRYRSYDPTTGTFLGYDGARHPCP
jgi:hypothetical protein